MVTTVARADGERSGTDEVRSSDDKTGQLVVLKKYGNRRLYDTRASTYVTIVEVEKMLLDGDDIQVVDAKSGDDITKEVLVQIIAEREGARDALPLSFLKEVVRVGRGPARRQFADAISSTLSAVLGTQQRMASEMERAAQAYAQTPFMNPFSMFFRPPSQLHGASQPPERDDMAVLREELKATQALVRELAQAQRENGASANKSEEVGRKTKVQPSSSRGKKAAKPG